MVEAIKKAGKGQVAPLCTWPAESCKIREGERLFSKVQGKAMGETEQKSPQDKGPPYLE